MTDKRGAVRFRPGSWGIGVGLAATPQADSRTGPFRTLNVSLTRAR